MAASHSIASTPVKLFKNSPPVPESPTLDRDPVNEMIKNLHEELDGHQPIEFFYVSILAEIKRMLGNPAYSGKMYTHYEYEEGR